MDPEDTFDDSQVYEENHTFSEGGCTILEVIENYGWYVLGFSIIAVYVYTKYVQPEIEKYLQRKADADYHKNPDLFQAKVLQMESRRAQMQAQYCQDAEKYQQKQEERDEKKRQERLDKLGNVSTGDKLGSSLKREYNPLMGESSGGYRAPKKGCGGKRCG